MSLIGANTNVFSGEYETRGQSGELWSRVNGNLLRDYNYGYGQRDDFLPYRAGDFTATQATTGSVDQIAGEGGIIEIDSGATTTTQGLNFQDKFACFRIPSDLTLTFEARIRPSGNGTGPNFFLGLAQADTTLIAASALTSQCVGIQSLTADNILLGVAKGASGATVTTSLGTLPTDGNTWMYLGFRIAKGVLTFSVDHVMKTGQVIRTNLPATTIDLARTVVCQSRGTTQPKIQLDWIDCFVSKQQP